jgi:molybdate transport system substrate-binding protein
MVNAWCGNKAGRWLGVCWALASLCLAAPSAAQPITVSAAASLSDAFREISQRFEASRPGVSVRLNLGNSGALLQQIMQGAPADVLASADEETVERGVAARALDGASRRLFAGNVLVLVVPATAPSPPSLLEDLASARFARVAVGKTQVVPAGRYARQALEAAGVWPAVQTKLVPADNVRQALDYVARGEVDAGFVYRTDALSQREQTRVRVALTASGHAPIRYPAAVVSDSRQPALAREFVNFLLGAEAQAILARQGFTPP